MSVTIKDVAKQANVAPSTVSRVIANNPRISEETKRRVRKAMDDLGYHPNFNARSLANRHTQAIGVVMPSSADKAFQNPFFPEVLRGISTKAHESSYTLYLSTGMTEKEIFDGVVGMVQGRRVDGVLLLYARVGDKIMEYLQQQNFPFTVIGKPHKGAESITHVDNDNYNAAKQVTERLIKLGHKRIAFIGGSRDLVVTIERLEGYKQALQNASIAIAQEYIVEEELLKEGGHGAIVDLLSIEKPPTALVVADDLMALGIISKLDEMGISIPDDISIISFNNVMLSEYTKPPLTSVDINIFKLGYEATDCLMNLISNTSLSPRRVIVPYELVERDSVKDYKGKQQSLQKNLSMEGKEK